MHTHNAPATSEYHIDTTDKTTKALTQELLALMKKPSAEDRKLIEKACAFARDAHKDHRRFSGEPYFNHLFATAEQLARLGMDAPTIAAGLLHDTIEDTNTTSEQIRDLFGDEVLFLVEGVTKLGELRYRGADKHVESLRRLFVATSKDVRVLMIKLMDRLHNMRTLHHVSQEKRERIAKETLTIYAPLADRLGMGILTKELQDLAFQHIDPDGYKDTKRIIEENNLAQEPKLAEVQTVLEKELKKQGLRHVRLEARVKGIYSLHTKLERKGGDIDKIYDMLAVRVIVSTVEDCYRALGIVHALWRPLPGKMKDYIASEKPNGYRSIHTTVMTPEAGPAEVQIRTEEMHAHSQFGIASHFSYKESGSIKNKGEEKSNQLWYHTLIPSLLNIRRKERGVVHAQHTPRWLEDLAEAHNTQAHKENDALFQAMQEDFFTHRIFVFTPRGDVVDLPVDSSPVDFAYAIHSDIGNHISGARVNGKFVALNTCLKNGDIVEIETKKSAKPSSKWIDYAKTTMAKKHVRQFLKEKEG
jgi:GTP diphosphokinase / guanosine-3',5'-bis(diphosphate) 3'-diphosphatase